MGEAAFDMSPAGQDQTSSVIEVDVYKGQVLLRHGKLCRFSLFDPQTSVDIATMMARASYSIAHNQPFGEHLLVTLKDEIINRKREILQNRLAQMIIPQMVEKKKTPKQIVNYVIDQVLKELS